MNIEFSYLYRDGANYKKYSSEIFSNITNISIAVINEHITSSLIESTWFVCSKWNLKDLHFDKWDEEIDHGWQEFEMIEETDESVTSGDIFTFLELIALDKCTRISL